MNLCLGVVLDGFSNSSEGMPDYAECTDEDAMRIFSHWSKYDPDGDSFIPLDRVIPFLMTLEQPWGFAGRDDLTTPKILLRLREMNLRVWSGQRVHIADMTARSRRCASRSACA